MGYLSTSVSLVSLDSFFLRNFKKTIEFPRSFAKHFAYFEFVASGINYTYLKQKDYLLFSVLLQFFCNYYEK